MVTEGCGTVGFPDELAAGTRTICAFCLSTSAGVRMKQETSSAAEEATLSIIGRGTSGVEEPLRVGLAFLKIVLRPS